jgi:uncharacterized membrane protein
MMLNKQASVSMPLIQRLFIVFLFVSSSILSTVIPPFQSPDEFEHITRAYLLGRGEFVLEAPVGQSSGGGIDSGLNQYMEQYASLPFNPDRKLSKSEIDAVKQIQWAGESQFRPALGMAYYFPAIYAVHTVGLFAGKHLDFSVDASYRLTRIILLVATCLILYGAFVLFSPSALTLALLMIPMSLFQFSSASLDGIATAIAIFLMSGFMRFSIDGKRSSLTIFILMLLGWLLIASSRLQLFPMVLLLIVSAVFHMRRPLYLLWIGFASAFVLGWQVVMMKTIVDGRVKIGASSGEIVLHYVQNPLALVEVISATLTNGDRMRGFFSSFFGLLGWLDTPFKGREYIYLLAMVVAILVLSVNLKGAWQARRRTVLLLIVALAAIGIVFFAMLVTWTPHPASLIDGVQGRYFLIPAVIISYALTTNSEPQSRVRLGLLWGLVILLGLYSVLSTEQLLFDRYYAAR